MQVIKSCCPARVGLLGNPSDGFGGKTLSFALGNYNAEVTLEEAEGIHILPNPELDRSTFATIDELAGYTAINVILFLQLCMFTRSVSITQYCIYS